MSAKILILDIETAPNKGYAWDVWETNLIEILEPTYLLCFGYKWLGEEDVTVHCLPDYPGYKKDRTNDANLVNALWQVLDEADIVVAHNGDSFDIKRSNARFVVHGLAPPSSYKTVDTLKLARKHFKFESNKLDSLGQILDLGEKLSHTGWKLWKGCIAGDDKSWETMREYNAQDVLLLEKVYLRLRPWASSHPNLSLYSGDSTDKEACPKCGSEKTQKRGLAYAQTRVYQRHHCLSCGSWFQGKYLKKSVTSSGNDDGE